MAVKQQGSLGKDVEGILTKVKLDRPPALILGAGSTNGLAFVRSLGRKGIPVIAVDDRDAPAMRSRYGLRVEQTWEDEGEAALSRFLEQVGQRLPVKGVIIPTSDGYVLFVSRWRRELSKYFEFVLCEESTLEKVANKKFQYQYADSIGVPIPKTYYLDKPGGLEEAVDKVSYPCIVKPVYSHLWHRHRQRLDITGTAKLAVCNSPQELVQMHSLVVDSGVEWVVQEKIEGSDDQLYALHTYFNRSSQPLAVFVRRKLRQWPVDFGNGSFSIGVSQDEITTLGVKLLRGLGFQGLANIEFKRDPADGGFKLIEINPRSASQVNLAVDSGVDIPFIAYKDSLGQSVNPVDSYMVGVRWINLGADFKSFRVYRRRKQLGFWPWLRSIKGARSYAFFAWDDPAPFLRETLAFAKSAGASMLRNRR